MRASAGAAERAGTQYASGWSDVERQPGPAAVPQFAAGIGRAAFDAAAPIRATEAAPLDHHRDRPDAAVRHAAIEPGTPVRPHTPLDSVTNLRVSLHATNLRPDRDSCQTVPRLD